MSENAPLLWEEWLERHGPALLLLARQYVGSRADAEDIVHDGFVRFWRSRGQAHNPQAYLLSCIKRAALNFIRDSKRRGVRERRREEMSSLACDPFIASIELNEKHEALQNGLARLPVEQREVLIMKVCGSLTIPEIAEVLEISPNTAASRYRYALEALRRMLTREVEQK
jgi:RNA polymerase sigma-70 factor (ECF subfamily)